jgi:hypothetical protein
LKPSQPGTVNGPGIGGENNPCMSTPYPFQRVIDRTGSFKMSRESFDQYQKDHPKEHSGRAFFSFLDANNIQYQVKTNVVILSNKY